MNGSRHDEGDERRNIRSMHGRGTPSPPAAVLSLKALQKLQLDRGSGGGGSSSSAQSGHDSESRQPVNGLGSMHGSASERSADNVYHSDLSDGGGHMSDTGRSVKSHISDASHITHFTEAHSVVSDGHQSAVSMDVNPPSSIAGSVTHSPPRSLAGSTYAYSYAGSIAGESIADRESSVDGSEMHPPLSPSLSHPLLSMDSPRGSHGGSFADLSAASSRSASPAPSPI